jgi:hypothetical protein
VSLGNRELEASYKGLSTITNDVWADVLSKLSLRGEWAAIRYVILGINFRFNGGKYSISAVMLYDLADMSLNDLM